MRAGFVTCVQLGLACMEEIRRVGGQLDFVVTLPDDFARAKSGRVYVDDFCAEAGITLFKSRSINSDESLEFIRTRAPDWMFIIGWSQIAGDAVLAAPRHGVLGAHPTLLPEGRGRAAIPWTILKGLTRSGVTFFKLESGVDTGPIVAQHELAVAPDETATTLYARVVEAHRAVIAELWPRLVTGEVPLIPQDESRATIWPGRKPSDGELHPGMTVSEADRLVRATTRPYPGAFIRTDSGLLRVWRGRFASGPVLEGVPRLRFSDGEYDAVDYDLESSGEAPPAARS